MTARLSDFDRSHIDEIMEGHGDWFSAQLLRLCHKADHGTLEQIRRGFPAHVELYESWLRREAGFSRARVKKLTEEHKDVLNKLAE